MQKVWVLVDLPHRKRAIGTKWVFRNKKDERGIIVRNKARLVAQGHTQEKGIDYKEVFALVARIEAIRLILAYASFMGFMLCQMDVKSAFLYGTIKEDVYDCQPPGFEDPNYPDKVYKVVKAIYGLHQAPRAWYETLANYLLENGFQRGKIDQTLFIKREKDRKSAITPIDTEKPFLKDPNGKDVDVHTYRSMIGSLMYLTSSRPDIMFASSVAMKKVNDIMRLQALVDKKKVIILKATIRDALRLDDAEGIGCLPNEEIFAELARMGYEKPSTKLTFYKAFFSSQWKFLIHTILQCMSAKRTSWNEFSSSMASAVICLSICRKFNFSNLVRNVGSSTKFYMYPRFLQLMIKAKVGKGFSGVETPLFEGMIVEQQVGDEGDAEVNVDDVPAVGVTAEGDVSAADDVVLLLLKKHLFHLLHHLLHHHNHHKINLQLSKIETFDDTVMDDVSKQERTIANIDADVDVSLDDAKEVVVENMQDVKESEPTELQEVVEVVTTAKLITKVVTAASATLTAATPQLTTAAAPTLTTAPIAARRRKRVIIRDPQETATPSIIIHSEAKSKDNGKGILMDYFKGMTYDDIRPIFEKNFNSNVAFLMKTMEQMDEEDSRALKRLSESQDDKTAKKKKLDEEIITFTTTQLILLVKRRYPLTRFTLDQMLNNVRLEVKEESEVSLELLSFGVDATEEFKENMISDLIGSDLLVGGIRTVISLDIDLQKEKSELDVKVVDLATSVKVRDREVADLDVVITSVRSQNDYLVSQVYKLEISSTRLQEKVTVYESCTEQLEKFQDDQMKIVNEKLDKLYVDFLELALHLEVKLYPRLLTTISSCRWLLTHGKVLAVVMCLNLHEYLSALGTTISKTIEKGMQEGLAIGFIHGKEGRVLTDVAAYNPSDSSIKSVMDILCLDEPLTEKLNLNELQPNVDQLMVPIHHSPDKVVVGASALSLALGVSDACVWRIQANIANHKSALHDYEATRTDDQATTNENVVGESTNPFLNVDDVELVVP
nr:putative ribonuclease H-like domain-containing protein [Tanacetum cinerariifolium]